MNETRQVKVLGTPLAGKSTIMGIVHRVFGGEYAISSIRMTEDGFWHNRALNIIDLHVNSTRGNGFKYVFRWASGGVPRIEAARTLLKEPQAKVILVFDLFPDRYDEQREYWEALRDWVPREEWYFILNKEDFSSYSSGEFLREIGTYLDRPSITISAARGDDPTPKIRNFFQNHILI